MSVISILQVAIAALTATSPVSGDFDGDGGTDTAAIISKADGGHDVIVTFANGRLASVDRVESGAELSVISAGIIDSLCRPIAKEMPTCTGQLAGRDRQGLWIKRIGGPTLQGLAVWTGSQFRLVTSLWPEDAATAAAETAAKYASSRTHPSSQTKSALRSILELDLAPSGKPEGCRVVEASGVPELDSKACSIMLQKARFRPASGASAGKRMTTRTEIVWRTK